MYIDNLYLCKHIIFSSNVHIFNTFRMKIPQILSSSPLKPNRLCSSLLGPIEIGDGATIGAGATVTKSVEAGASVIDTSYTKNKVLAPKKKKS